MLKRMDSAEISLEMAFDQVHLDDSWYQMSRICECVVNSQVGRKKPIDPKLFLPKTRTLRKKPVDVRAKIEAWRNAYNASLKDKDSGNI